MNTIGERIKWLRKDRLHLTQELVGNYIGVGKATVQKYEKGVITNIPADKIMLLSEILQTTPAFIMGWSENPERFLTTPVSSAEWQNKKQNGEIIELLSSLSQSSREQAIDYLRFLATRREKE